MLPKINKLLNCKKSVNFFIISWISSYVQVEGKVVPVQDMKPYRGNRDIGPLILNHGTKWRFIVTFMPQPFKSSGIPDTHWSRCRVSPRASPESLKRNSFAPTGNQTQVHPVHSLVTTLTMLSSAPILHIGVWHSTLH